MTMLRARRSVAVGAVVLAALAVGLFIDCFERDPGTQEIVAAAPAAAATSEGRVQITYPTDGTLFPPESVAPTFVWEDATGGVDRWNVVVRDATGVDVATASVDAPRWRPSEDTWTRIKQQSRERDAEVIVAGASHTQPATVSSSARVRIRTSKDPVGDSLFYREVPLPFLEAVQDPSRIRWRFGTIDSQSGPPIVL